VGLELEVFKISREKEHSDADIFGIAASISSAKKFKVLYWSPGFNFH